MLVDNRTVMLLTLCLSHLARINTERDLEVGQTRVLRQMVLLVDGVEHFLAAIIHDLLETEAIEAELEHFRLVGRPEQAVLAAIVVEEVGRAEFVPTHNSLDV